MYNDIMNYLLVGSEYYNLKRRREQIIAQTVNSDPMNVSIYHSNDEYTLMDVINDSLMVPFLADNKVVIVENSPLLTNGKHNENEQTIQALYDYLQHSSLQTTLIFYCDAPVDKRKKIFTDLTKLMKYESYDELTVDEFENYVRRDLIDNNIKLDILSLNELLSRLPISIENWKKELEKLLLYPNSINVEVIKELINRPLENNAFDLSNAVLNKDLSKALTVYNDLLVTNKNDIMSLIGLLASQFRFMYQAKLLTEQHYSLQECAKMLNCKEFRVTMGLRNANHKSSMDILKILNDLSTLDQNIKKGVVDQIVGLELFIIRTISE